MTMDKTRETMFVALAFTSIGTVASIIICLCIRRSIAIKHKSPLPPGGRMEEVKLELEKIDGRIINEILIIQEWLPSYVWKKFNEGAMDEMMVALRIEEKDKGIATKMAMVALWCIHHRPEVRPLMSSVVKMLEGRVVIDRPLNPFRPPMTPVRLDLLQNVGGNIPSASSASSNWIAAFSTDNSYASSASHNWITPLSREDYIFLR
ncbi:hypothetical protein MRB53_013302 [Persea americana]|uniref:Uncharacterized protein n=1 Tax=Persea americana TaxID=3435 RepID=A0ACC2K7M4_PERAE|nr:hypothetical protein MRB53_013302 [Persea americana]